MQPVSWYAGKKMVAGKKTFVGKRDATGLPAISWYARHVERTLTDYEADHEDYEADYEFPWTIDMTEQTLNMTEQALKDPGRLPINDMHDRAGTEGSCSN
jgi:hypothetical protein